MVFHGRRAEQIFILIMQTATNKKEQNYYKASKTEALDLY